VHITAYWLLFMLDQLHNTPFFTANTLNSCSATCAVCGEIQLPASSWTKKNSHLQPTTAMYGVPCSTLKEEFLCMALQQKMVGHLI